MLLELSRTIAEEYNRLNYSPMLPTDEGKYDRTISNIQNNSIVNQSNIESSSSSGGSRSYQYVVRSTGNSSSNSDKNYHESSNNGPSADGEYQHLASRYSDSVSHLNAINTNFASIPLAPYSTQAFGFIAPSAFQYHLGSIPQSSSAVESNMYSLVDSNYNKDRSMYLPEWLRTDGTRCFSDKKNSAMDGAASKKKRYKKVICIYCAAYNPNSKWGSWKARKFETSILQMHEKSRYHRKAVESKSRTIASNIGLDEAVKLSAEFAGSESFHNYEGNSSNDVDMVLPYHRMQQINNEGSSSHNLQQLGGIDEDSNPTKNSSPSKPTKKQKVTNFNNSNADR